MRNLWHSTGPSCARHKVLASLSAIVAGLILLLWSAERFVSSASALAAHLGVPALLIGMIVVGFGTSAPEMTVSVISAAGGNPGLALGNAYGSNITNIALILGLAALVRPIQVRSRVLRAELPVLIAATALAGSLLIDGVISRLDAGVLLGAFAALLAWSLWTARRQPADALGQDIEHGQAGHPAGPGRSGAWLIVSLVTLVASSRLVVWGAVHVAQQAGISDLVIGLTIVAIGTSLPELASSIVAARRGEHELAFGNILGSNLFNTLAVVGLAGLVSPMAVDPALVERDLPVVVGLTLLLLVFGYRFRGPGRINRIEGGLLLAGFVSYTAVLLTR